MSESIELIDSLPYSSIVIITTTFSLNAQFIHLDLITQKTNSVYKITILQYLYLRLTIASENSIISKYLFDEKRFNVV